VTIQMKAVDEYIFVVLFVTMLYSRHIFRKRMFGIVSYKCSVQRLNKTEVR